MTSETFLQWRRLLGVRDEDSAEDVDDAINCEFIEAAAQKRRPLMSRIRDRLQLPPDPRFM